MSIGIIVPAAKQHTYNHLPSFQADWSGFILFESRLKSLSLSDLTLWWILPPEPHFTVPKELSTNKVYYIFQTGADFETINSVNIQIIQ